MKKNEQLVLEDFLENFGKEKDMAGDDSNMGAVVDALQGLTERIDRMMGNGRRRGRHREDEDEPESVREMESRGRRGEPRQVAFEIRVPVGRNGGTLKGLLIFDEVRVRDDRDLEDLANEVERKFRLANVFQKQDFNRNGGGYGGGNGYYRDRGGWDRDRDWRR